MLRQSILFVLRRPSIIFTMVTLTMIVLMFKDAPALSLTPPRSMRSMLFQMDRHAAGKRRKPVRKSDLVWDKPRLGIATALRYLRESQLAPASPNDEGDFWRDFYEKELVKWALPVNIQSAQQYQDNLQKTRCVALTGGSISFQRVALNFKIIRELHPNIPVYTYHVSKDPFDDRQREYLQSPQLLDELFTKGHPNVNINADTIRLYAAMACPCEQVIVIDSDVILFNDPLVYFDQTEQGHSLFFKDRKLHPNNDGLVAFLLDNILLQPISAAMSTMNMFTQQSSFQQDSSLVVLNKREYRWLGLVAAIGLASDPVRQAWHGNFRGDKETWWMGWEVAGCDYLFESTDPASIGFPMDQDGQPAVCGGKLLHFNSTTAVWASGGVDHDENDGPKLDAFSAVSDGTGKWTLGLCQVGPVKGDWAQHASIGSGWSRIKRLYKADPLLA